MCSRSPLSRAHAFLLPCVTSSGGARMTCSNDSPRASAQSPPGQLPAPLGPGSAASAHIPALAPARKKPANTARATSPEPVPTPPGLLFRLLGAPEVQVARTPLVLRNQKAQALLFYLAVTGRPHTR